MDYSYCRNWCDDEHALVDVHLFPSDAKPGDSPLPVHSAKLGSRTLMGMVAAQMEGGRRPVEVRLSSSKVCASKETCLFLFHVVYSPDDDTVLSGYYMTDQLQAKIDLAELFALLHWCHAESAWKRMCVLQQRIITDNEKLVMIRSCSSFRGTMYPNDYDFVLEVGAIAVGYADMGDIPARQLANAALGKFKRYQAGLSKVMQSFDTRAYRRSKSALPLRTTHSFAQHVLRFGRILSTGRMYPMKLAYFKGKRMTFDMAEGKEIERFANVGRFCAADWTVCVCNFDTFGGHYEWGSVAVTINIQDSSGFDECCDVDDWSDHDGSSDRDWSLMRKEWPFRSEIVATCEWKIVDANGAVLGAGRDETPVDRYSTDGRTDISICKFNTDNIGNSAVKCNVLLYFTIKA